MHGLHTTHVSGSGAEDIGIRREVDARIDENRNRAAEDSVRLRRLQRARVIDAALIALGALAIEHHTYSVDNYLAGYCDVPAEDVSSLIAEIRAELSPVVTGRA